jgi:dihydroorotate dehydrogenase
MSVSPRKLLLGGCAWAFQPAPACYRAAVALFPLFRPLVHALDAERAHRLTIAALKRLPTVGRPVADPVLASSVAGLAFPNPVGLAAGFDKDAEVPQQMLALGFGFVEVGTLTPRPQAGNPQPRLFRLVEDRAVINRMGFNNGGQDAALARLDAIRERAGPIGVNIGANKDAANRIADYAAGARTMGRVADYLAINVSSPNTPGLRSLQDPAALAELLDGIREATGGLGPPMFLKVAPDLSPDEIDAIARCAVEGGVSGLIVGNTTVSRPGLRSPQGGEAGGLSGAPLAALALDRLRAFRRATGGTLPLIAAGGIGDADAAYARIRAGASLVQLYSALVFEGPGLAVRIARGLAERLRRDGFAALRDAIGADA